jgi:polar amino acid transport system substrate-binding protein
MTHRKLTLAVLAFLALFIMPLNALFAEDTGKDLLKAIEARGTLVVGTSADYPPFEFVDKNKEFAGYDIDLIREIGKRMNLKVKILDMPFDSLIAAVQKKKIDATIAVISITDARGEKVDYTEPYFHAADAVLVTKDSGIKISKLEEVAKLKTGVQTGTSHDTWLTETLLKPGVMSKDMIFRYERVDQAALDLKAKRIDLLLMDQIPAKLIAQKMGLVIAFEGFVTQEPAVIVLPEGAGELKRKMDTIIGQLKSEGFLDKLADTHLRVE